MGFDNSGLGMNAGYGTSNNGGYGGYGLNSGLGFSSAPYYYPGMDPNGLQGDAFQRANGQKKGNPITGFFKGMAQGAVNTVKGLFTPQGILMTAAGAGLIWATGGLAVLPLAAIGAGVGGYQMLKGAAAGSAEGVGEGFFTAAASVLGAKFTPKSVKVGGTKYTLNGKTAGQKGGFMDSVKAMFGKRKYQHKQSGNELNLYQLSMEKAKTRFGGSNSETAPSTPPNGSTTPKPETATETSANAGTKTDSGVQTETPAPTSTEKGVRFGNTQDGPAQSSQSARHLNNEKASGYEADVSSNASSDSASIRSGSTSQEGGHTSLNSRAASDAGSSSSSDLTLESVQKHTSGPGAKVPSKQRTSNWVKEQKASETPASETKEASQTRSSTNPAEDPPTPPSEDGSFYSAKSEVVSDAELAPRYSAAEKGKGKAIEYNAGKATTSESQAGTLKNEPAVSSEQQPKVAPSNISEAKPGAQTDSPLSPEKPPIDLHRRNAVSKQNNPLAGRSLQRKDGRWNTSKADMQAEDGTWSSPKDVAQTQTTPNVTQNAIQTPKGILKEPGQSSPSNKRVGFVENQSDTSGTKAAKHSDSDKVRSAPPEQVQESPLGSSASTRPSTGRVSGKAPNSKPSGWMTAQFKQQTPHTSRFGSRLNSRFKSRFKDDLSD